MVYKISGLSKRTTCAPKCLAFITHTAMFRVTIVWSGRFVEELLGGIVGDGVCCETWIAFTPFFIASSDEETAMFATRGTETHPRFSPIKLSLAPK